MNHHVLLFALALSACGPGGRPVRTSPLPTPIPGLAVASDAVFDLVGSVPTWYEPSTRRVVQLADGALAQVQDRTLTAVPDVLRVLPDGSIVYLVDQDLHMLPADGADEIVEHFSSLDFAFDGTRWDDIWYVIWRVEGESPYELCHRTAASTDCVTTVPNVGAYSPQLVIAADGSIYVTDRDESIYRFAGGALTLVGRVTGGVVRFRPSTTGVGVMAYSELFTLVGTTLTRVVPERILDVVGPPEALVVMTYDSESERVDPSCQPTLLTGCPTRVVWEEIVITEHTPSGARELGHESCEIDLGGEACGRTAFGIALDGDDVVLMGAPLRTVAR